MAIRPSTSRRTCTLAELVSWVIFSDVNCSDDVKNSRPNNDFELARADIEAALRDGNVQPLGYLTDSSFARIGIKDIVAAVDSGREDQLPKAPTGKAERIPPDFWAFAEVDWAQSRAKTKTLDYVKIQFLMSEVIKIWPSDKLGEQESPAAVPMNATEDAGNPTVQTMMSPLGATPFLGEIPLAKDIPASDRLVPLNHNSPQVHVTVKAIDDVIAGVEKANDIGDLTAGEKAIVLSQLREARKLFDFPEIKISAAKNLVAPALRWIADKVGGTAVGNLALQALAAISKLLGI